MTASLALLIMLATSAPGDASRAIVSFPERAEVAGSVIRLGEIAHLECADAGLAARLRAVEVGTAPLPGHSRVLSAEYARVRVRALGPAAAGVRFQGAARIAVARAAQVVPGTAIEAAARDAIQAAFPGVTAEAMSVVPDQRLPVGAVELVPLRVPPAVGSSSVLPVQLRVDGRPEATVTVSLRVGRRAPTLVAARDLPVGTAVAESDLQVEERAVLPGPTLLSDPVQAVGMETSLPVRAGTALTASMLRPAVLIKRGSRVRLICRGPAFTASVAGEALQDGVAGRPIRVRNLTSLLEVTGLPVDSQTVEVPF